MGPITKQIAKLNDTKGAMVTRVRAVLNMGGSHILYLLYIVNRFRIVEPGKSYITRARADSCRHSHGKPHKLAVFGHASHGDRAWK
jgi:hypothetical protein